MPSIYRHLIIVFVWCLPLTGQKVAIPLDEAGEQGVLNVLFITSFGDPISDEPRLSVENASGKPVGGLKVGRNMTLGYGTYRLKAHYPGCYPVEKVVKINSPFQTISICFFISPIESPWDGNLVRGRISDESRANDCRWVRFVSPFADGEVADAKATETGYFALENVLPGKYLVFAIGKKGICEMAEATIFLEVGKPVFDFVFPWAALEEREAKRLSRDGKQ